MSKKNQKIEEFKLLLRFVDWSTKKFSDIYLNEISPYDLDESEYEKHHNKVKARLKELLTQKNLLQISLHTSILLKTPKSSR